MATVVSATALDLRTVRIVFSAAVDVTALDPDVWALAGTSTPPFALPTVELTDGVDSETTPTSVDLGLSFDLSPGAGYTVTATGVTGVVAPNNVAAFSVAALPVVAGRAFSFLRWIPAMNLREDDTEDLRNFLAAVDESLLLLLNDVDRFGDIQDPDLAPEVFLDQQILDFGGPVDDAVLTLQKKRLWAKSIVYLYKQIGTVPGLRNAIKFFLGFDSSVIAYNRQGMRLGSSLLGLDWILGPGDAVARLAVRVATPEGRAFTDYEERVLAQIIALVGYAHETMVVQATLPAPSSVSAEALGTPDGIALTWTAVAGATGYAVFERSIAGATVLNGKRRTSVTTYMDLEMLAGQHRYFVIAATNAQGDGLASVEVDAISG
jgi:phage tail-like protein